MTREEAIQFYRDEIQYLKAAPRVNGCEMKDYWQRQIDIHTMALEALGMVFCRDCAAHNHCQAERVYLSENIAEPFCCRGVRR